MGDLKTPFNNPIYPDTSDLAGAGVTSRGSDPNAEGDNNAGEGLTGIPWDGAKQPVTRTETAESANSVSGLPSLPTRFEPNETPPEPPNLTSRSPQNVDK
jgi:hypothetical protein